MVTMFIRRVWRLRRVPFVRNLGKLQAGMMLAMVIGLLTSIVQTRWLGLSGYGTLAIVTAFAGLLNFFTSLGQEVTFAIFLSEAVGRKDKVAIHAVLRYFLQTTLLSIAVVIALAVAAPALAESMLHNRQIGTFASLMIVNIGLQAPPLLYFLLLQFQGRVGTMTILESVRTTSQFVLMTALLMGGFGISGVLWAILIPSAVFFPLCIALYERDCAASGLPSLASVLRQLFRGGTGQYVRQGLWITLDKSVANNIYPNVFFMALSATASTEIIGLFRLALRLAGLPTSLYLSSINRLAAVQVPLLIGRSAKEARDASWKLVKGTVGLSLIAMAGAAVAVPVLLPYVYGREFIPAIPAFLIMLPMNFFSASAIVTIPVLRLFRRTYMSLINSTVGVVLGVGIYYLLRVPLGPLFAVSIGVLYVFAQVLVLHAYTWRMLRATSSPLA